MVIQDFACIDFRNYKELRLEFSAKVNLFIGKNGQGKTNLVEGIYFTNHLDSFRTHRPQKLIRFGQPLSLLQVTLADGGIARKCRIEVTKIGRKVWLDDAPTRKLSEYITNFYAVVFNPDSLHAFRHFPTERRNFFDRFLAFLDPTFLQEIRAFRSVHGQKNRLLKGGDFSSLSDWNVLFAEKSCVIVKKRQELVERINKLLPDLYARISGRSQRLWLEPLPSLKGDVETCRQFLERAAESEKRAGYALHGPHRDDFRILIGEGQRDEYFSQGEYRIALLALKLAASALMEEQIGFQPILILDDVFSELDQVVKGALETYLDEISNQIFITSTDLKEGGDFPRARIMEIRAGRVV